MRHGTRRSSGASLSALSPLKFSTALRSHRHTIHCKANRIGASSPTMAIYFVDILALQVWILPVKDMNISLSLHKTSTSKFDFFSKCHCVQVISLVSQ